MESRAGGQSGAGSARAKKPPNRSLSNSDVAGYEKNDGSMSDSAVTSSLTEVRKRRPSLGYKVAALVGLSRRSSSTSQLSATGEAPPCAKPQTQTGGGILGTIRASIFR